MPNDLMDTNKTDVLINSILLQLSLLLMHEAAILDAKVGVGGVHPTFRFGNTTSGSVPVEIFNWELRNV